MMLVTLAQAKDHLRVIDDDEDNDISLKIMAASEAVVRYLKTGATFLDSSGDVEEDSNGDAVGVPYLVQMATLMMVGFMYKDRDENKDSAYEMGYLPKPVTAMLYSMRSPSLA